MYNLRKLNDSRNGSEFIARDLRHLWSDWIKLSPDDIWISEESIEIKQLEIVSNVLTYFGDAIRKLTLFTEFTTNGNVYRYIGRMMNEHCSEMLERIEVWYSFETVLKHLTKPFRAVKSVKLSYFPNRDGDDCLPMDELFPNMEQLDLKLSTALNSSYIVRHHPNLNSLKIQDLSYKDEIHSTNPDAAGLEKLIELNPQIRNIDFEAVPSHRVKFVGEHLPNLDSLTLAKLNGEDEIHFQNVTTFRAEGSPTNIRFDHLQELHINGFVRTEKWDDFIEKHSTIQKLHIPMLELNADAFMAFTKHVPNVQEMTISIYLAQQWIEPTILIGFLNKHGKLQKFSILGTNLQPNESFVEILRDNLHTKWIITSNDHEFSFERILHVGIRIEKF